MEIHNMERVALNYFQSKNLKRYKIIHGYNFGLEWTEDGDFCFIDDGSAEPYKYRVKAPRGAVGELLGLLEISESECRFI